MVPGQCQQPIRLLGRHNLLLLLLLLLLTALAKGQTTGSSASTTEEPNAGLSTETATSPAAQTVTYEESNDFQGIPGTTQTTNGYDTALGNDAICWVGFTNSTTTNSTSSTSNATSASDLVKQVFPNPLVEDFVFQETTILNDCPANNTVTVQKPVQAMRGERLRTLQYYNYTLHVELDLDELLGDYLVTDDRNDTIALQVVVCSLGKSGFCSPFVHEQANLKDAIAKVNSGANLTVTAKKVKGNLHGGTHIHSPWVFLQMQNERRLDTNVTVSMLVNEPGDYFVIGTVQLYTAVNGTTAYRYDISNALEAGVGRYLSYQDPPVINDVSDGVLNFSYVAIALAASVLLFLIGQALRHRDHQVLQLSQVDFLIVFLICALIATCSTFLLTPKNDVYCRISYPLLLIPIQLMYAITVGRLWRIHAVISPLLLEHLSKGKPGLVQRFVQAITFVSYKFNNLFTCKKKNMRRSKMGIKQQISQFQLTCVVAMFALPQVLIQIVALIAQPQERVIQLNEDESEGRATCDSGASNAENLLIYSFLMLVLLVIILLVMAHSSRKLPSLFNETNVIYDSTFLSMVLLLLGGAVIALTDSPSSSPDVEYLVTLVLVLSITTSPAVRIMLPKLKMVWKNETVIVSKLVTDHHRKARDKQATRVSKATTGVSGLDASDSRYQNSFSRYGDYDVTQSNGLLPQTLNSNSNDLGGRSSVISGKSSVASNRDANNNYTINNDITPITEHPFQTSVQTFAGDEEQQQVYHTGRDDYLLDKLEPEDEMAEGTLNEQLASVNFNDAKGESSTLVETVTKELEKGTTDRTASSTDLDIVSGELDPAPFGGTVAVRGAGNKAADPTDNQPESPQHVTGAQSEGGTTDDERDLETAAGVASAFEPLPGDKGKKTSFFDHRASGFLKNAMAKGMSWRVSDRFDGGKDKASSKDKEKDTEKGDLDEFKKMAPTQHKHRPTRLSKRMVVTEDETPARRLVLKMLDLQDQLEGVNNKIMSGLAVTREDWAVITKLTGKLDHTFNEEVEFEWDMVRKYEESLRHVMPADMAGSGHLTEEHKDHDEKLRKPTQEDQRIQRIKRKTSSRTPGTEATDDDTASPKTEKQTFQKQTSNDTQFTDEPKGGEAEDGELYFV